MANPRGISLTIPALIGAILLAGCAGGGGPGGDPGAQALPAGMTCQTIRGELNKLDAKGTQSKVEALNAGKPLQPQHRADAERYNQLLNYYLGARCHA
jgi:hypothetical protein